MNIYAIYHKGCAMAFSFVPNEVFAFLNNNRIEFKQQPFNPRFMTEQP
jgi:hypothetical protein